MQLSGTKKIIGGLALAASFVLTGAVGLAQQQQGPTQEQGRGERAGRQWRGEGGKQRHGRRGGFFFGRFGEKLNLTDAQKAQIEQIAARYRESAKALRQQAGKRRGDEFDALKDGTFNEAAVRAAAQARANHRVEMEVMRARMLSEMYAVLTPEQKAQLAAERQQRQQQRQQRRQRRGNNTTDQQQ